MLPRIPLENEVFRQFLLAVLIFGGIYLLVRIAQRVSARYIDEPARRYRATQLIRRTGLTIAISIVVIMFWPALGNLLSVLTIFGAGLAIGLREVLLSFAAGLRLNLFPPYKQGDRIEINGIRGDVIDIRLMRTTLMEVGGWVDADQSTGRLVNFPNNWIFMHAVQNYTLGFQYIWNELSVTMSLDSDWEAASEILYRLAKESAAIVEQQAAEEIRRMSREYLIHYSILSPFVYVNVVEGGIRLTLRYMCEARKRRGTEHAFTITFLRLFKEHENIHLL